MLKSMTGYGVASFESDSLSIIAEIKTLNSKFLDTTIKLPRAFFDKELEVKNLLAEKLERGKVSVNINFLKKDDDVPKISVNKKLFKTYYKQLLELADDLNANRDEIFKLALQSPEVIVAENGREKLQNDWKRLVDTLKEAITKCDEFRQNEGSVLKKKLVVYVDKIETFLNKIDNLDKKRTIAIKDRIQQHMKEVTNSDAFDPNRFEQEMIYYLEKLDISEEKVRLKSHLDYFLDILNNESTQGKKLGFVSQEIGREINTIGSKANDAQIQKNVVGMKDELEKIKEQLLNIL